MNLKDARTLITGGSSVNVAPMGAVNGFANGSACASSKSAITGLTKSRQAGRSVRATHPDPESH